MKGTSVVMMPAAGRYIMLFSYGWKLISSFYFALWTTGLRPAWPCSCAHASSGHVVAAQAHSVAMPRRHTTQPSSGCATSCCTWGLGLRAHTSEGSSLAPRPTTSCCCLEDTALFHTRTGSRSMSRSRVRVRCVVGVLARRQVSAGLLHTSTHPTRCRFSARTSSSVRALVIPRRGIQGGGRVSRSNFVSLVALHC